MFRKTALPELLSPAGSFDAVVAAVNAGADAVYFGGKQLNARAFAKNLDDEEIARAILYCRLHGAKAYVTLNTLLSERELEAAVKRAGELRELGVDALIVADVGLISRLTELYPDLPIHASTQAQDDQLLEIRHDLQDPDQRSLRTRRRHRQLQGPAEINPFHPHPPKHQPTTRIRYHENFFQQKIYID